MNPMNRMIALAGILGLSVLSLFAQNTEKPFFLQNAVKYTPVKNQGNTGTCWSFSAASFIESELLRMGKPATDLSEMYFVRKIYLEKGEKYLRHQGTCYFSQGSLAHDFLNTLKKYGAVPESVYSGKKSGEKHDHTLLEKELKSFLDTMLARKKIEPHWKESYEAILDKHMGEVPAVFQLEEGIYNPLTYAQKWLGINPEDYVSITSFEHHPFYAPFILEVPDNWSHGSFYNLPLPEMMLVVNNALQNKYSVEWDGDVSEPGFRADLGVAMYLNKKEDLVQLKKLPVEKPVTVTARQAAFDNHETTDDHLMHITGTYTNEVGDAYYEVKNSWGEKISFNGFLYMSDTYFQMKTVSIMVHKNAVPVDIKQKLGF